MGKIKANLKRAWQKIKPARLCVYIGIGLAFFFDLVSYPFWDFTIFPWYRLGLGLLLMIIFYIEYKRLFPHEFSKLFVTLAFLPAAAACVQFFYLSHPSFLTFGEVFNPTNRYLIDNILAWLLPTMSLSIATVDVVVKILKPMRLTREVKVQALKAVWYIPAILLASLPAVFHAGYSYTSPIPVRELAVYIMIALLCFVWLVEAPGYRALTHSKQYLVAQLRQLEQVFDILDKLPSYEQGVKAMLRSSFRVIPNLSKVELTQFQRFKAEHPKAHDVLNLPTDFVGKWINSQRTFERNHPRFLAELLQDVAIFSVLELKLIFEQAGLPSLISAKCIKKQALLRLESRFGSMPIIDLENKTTPFLRRGIDGEFEELDLQKLPFLPVAWRVTIVENVKSRFLEFLGLDNVFVGRLRWALLELLITWNQNILKILFRDLRQKIPKDSDMLRQLRRLDQEIYFRKKVNQTEQLVYDWFHEGVRKLWEDIRGSDITSISSSEQEEALQAFADTWLNSTFDMRRWLYKYYPFANLGLESNSALSSTFDASNHQWITQLLQKERNWIMQESNHPFPELAALASVSGVATLIAIALRFI